MHSDSLFPQPQIVNWHASHLMIDLETYGLRNDAAIAAIGACHFDPYRHSTHEELAAHGFCVVIDRMDSARRGRSIDIETLKWWATQPAEAQAALTLDPQPLDVAIHRFLLWLSNWCYTSTGVWANSPQFDLIKLQDTMSALGQLWPLPFWIERDIRTLDHLAWPNGDRPPPERPLHDALNDAIYQARRVQWAYSLLGLATAQSR